MNPTPTNRHQQQNHIRQQASQTDSWAMFNLLTSDQLFDEVERHCPEHRERLFPPTETLSMFLAQGLAADRSCQNIVDQAAVKRLTSGLTPNSTATGAYCRARQRLPSAMVSGLTRFLGQRIDEQSVSEWRWDNRRVCVVDGTTLTMPDTASNQLRFPQQGSQKPGLGFPICRLVGVTSLSTGALLDAAVGRFNGKGANEQALLRDILDVFEPGDVVLGDAFYPTWFLLAEMLCRKVDIVMEQQGARRRSTDFRTGQKLGARDHLITIKKPVIRPDWLSVEAYEQAPDSLIVREFKAGGKVMVTTLLDAKVYPKNNLKALYRRRWEIEVTLRDIKQTLGMNILSCHSPEMIIKEIWVYLLAYNLIRLLMCQAASAAGALPTTLSFKHCLQLCLCCLNSSAVMNDEMLASVLLLMAQQRVGNRAGRVEPRAVKRRPKAYPLLMERRCAARDRVRKNGHPVKLK